MARPLCFVLMPFGQKKDPGGSLIDFDAVYGELIRPAIETAELEPIRADEEQVGGLIHRPMFERLVMCDYAVADLTTANANVFYELGVRHAVRPYSTVSVFWSETRLPFDVGPLRGLPYQLGAGGKPAAPEADGKALAKALQTARQAATDSPLFQMLDYMKPQKIDHKKTDLFREQVLYSEGLKGRLRQARGQGAEAVRAVETELGDLADVEAGVAVDLFLSYRAVKDWDAMIELAERMPRPLAQTVLVREQLGFALNRAGRGEEAEQVLRELIDERGPSSETYGLLGRVYKDRWEAAKTMDEEILARGELDKAIQAYLAGFEADWRDAYPGINAVTLMELREPPDERRLELLPVVTYAVGRAIAAGKPDYWDWATLLELAVLGSDREAAYDALARALAEVREPWEPETTARNLRLIRTARTARDTAEDWLEKIEAELENKQRQMEEA